MKSSFENSHLPKAKYKNHLTFINNFMKLLQINLSNNFQSLILFIKENDYLKKPKILI